MSWICTCIYILEFRRFQSYNFQKVKYPILKKRSNMVCSKSYPRLVKHAQWLQGSREIIIKMSLLNPAKCNYSNPLTVPTPLCAPPLSHMEDTGVRIVCHKLNRNALIRVVIICKRSLLPTTNTTDRAGQSITNHGMS